MIVLFITVTEEKTEQMHVKAPNSFTNMHRSTIRLHGLLVSMSVNREYTLTYVNDTDIDCTGANKIEQLASSSKFPAWSVRLEQQRQLHERWADARKRT